VQKGKPPKIFSRRVVNFFTRTCHDNFLATSQIFFTLFPKKCTCPKMFDPSSTGPKTHLTGVYNPLFLYLNGVGRDIWKSREGTSECAVRNLEPKNIFEEVEWSWWQEHIIDTFLQPRQTFLYFFGKSVLVPKCSIHLPLVPKHITLFYTILYFSI